MIPERAWYLWIAVGHWGWRKVRGVAFVNDWVEVCFEVSRLFLNLLEPNLYYQTQTVLQTTIFAVFWLKPPPLIFTFLNRFTVRKLFFSNLGID